MRKAYRTTRYEYQGASTSAETLTIHFQQQAMQGPAGWQNMGLPGRVYVPMGRLLHDDVTETLDKIVRRELNGIWDPSKGTEPLF
jgi:hypothetical protein